MVCLFLPSSFGLGSRDVSGVSGPGDEHLATGEGEVLKHCLLFE